MRTEIVGRKLSDRERAVIEELLNSTPELWNKYSRQLDSVRVAEMSDGGMGSLLFDSKRGKQRSLEKSIVEGEFLDKDDVVVSISLNVDQYGDLFELDAWKVDFSPLIAWPEPEQVAVK